jgi:hypothetical protein
MAQNTVFNQTDFDMASAYFECADAIANGTSPLPDGCLAPVQKAKGDSCQ